MMRARRQRGAVALELALTLAFLFPVAATLLFYGRLLYNYEVAQKATHDAARYLSGVSMLNMQNSDAAVYEVAVTKAIVQQELSVLTPYKLLVTVSCDGLECGGLSVPSMVAVGVQIKVHNNFYGYAPELVDQTISATQNMRYVGN
ncbi:hypothetical protein GTP55_06080 [Duganella sp. FT109W]|uniref:TadE-like domain-containing protein n=1 Tax=Duganella margarita TaxID=2692170 RepID=A0A7X4H625_9BURK|nr:TadE family protein [Duganella margarita]MYM76038.1 hypothetical protein [Duganella margarita]MYN38936.1 hypothetical protein [Duganella margarita]